MVVSPALLVVRASDTASVKSATRDNPVMSDLAPRTSRSVREQRAYRLVTIGGIASLVGLVSLILAFAGVVGGWIPIVSFIVAAVCIAMFRGMTKPR